MTNLNINNPDDFTTYPTNHVCAIIDTGEEARNTLDALLRSGIEEDDIEIFYGSAGVEVLDADAEHHGIFAKVAKQLRAYGDVENETMKLYEGAMQKGGYVFEVKADTDEKKETIHHIFLNNNAHEINYFGSWYVETMKEV